jgi:hypothetical protein
VHKVYIWKNTDLQKVSNENLDTIRKSVRFSFRNENGVRMNYQVMLTAQRELAMNRVTCKGERTVIID